MTTTLLVNIYIVVGGEFLWFILPQKAFVCQAQLATTCQRKSPFQASSTSHTPIQLDRALPRKELYPLHTKLLKFLSPNHGGTFHTKLTTKIIPPSWQMLENH